MHCIYIEHHNEQDIKNNLFNYIITVIGILFHVHVKMANPCLH